MLSDSAIVLGPALVTTQSETAIHSGTFSTKPQIRVGTSHVLRCSVWRNDSLCPQSTTSWPHDVDPTESRLAI